MTNLSANNKQHVDFRTVESVNIYFTLDAFLPLPPCLQPLSYMLDKHIPHLQYSCISVLVVKLILILSHGRFDRKQAFPKMSECAFLETSELCSRSCWQQSALQGETCNTSVTGSAYRALSSVMADCLLHQHNLLNHI